MKANDEVSDSGFGLEVDADDSGALVTAEVGGGGGGLIGGEVGGVGISFCGGGVD